MVIIFDSHTGVSRKLNPKLREPYNISTILRNDRYIVED